MDDGLILGRYRPIEEAGSGGYGTVMVAWDTRIQRRVAIKEMTIDPDLVPPPTEDGTPYNVAEIPGLEEARTAALLTDPAIVGVLDFEIEGVIAYLIMEYIDGCTLTQLLRDFPGRITPDVVGAVFKSVSHALQVAHENQVLHLDIKPDNVLINRKGEVKVTDFGLSKLSNAEGFDRAAGGTIGYMPPEQMNLLPLDARCDEWALASLTYEMISGDNPFFADNLEAAKRIIGDAELVLPHLCMEGLDPQLDDVLFYALEPDREQRYETVADFAEELQPFLGNPLKGQRQLQRLVGAATDDAPESAPIAEADPDSTAVYEPTPKTSRSFRLLKRLWAVVNCGLLGAVGLSCLSPWIGTFQAAPFWVLLAVVVISAALLPQLGSLLAVVAFGVALVMQGAYLAGAALLVTCLLWWWFSGRRLFETSNAPLSVVPLSVVGLGAVTPIICGYFLKAKDAVLGTLFAAVLALALAGSGASELGSWNPMELWGSTELASSNTLGLDTIRGLVTTPGLWIDLFSWVVAAALLALFCSRSNRGLAFVGAVLAGAILILAVFARTWAESAGMVVMPHPLDFLRSVVPLAVGGVLCIYKVPARD
ncbi:MAG: serine/threonine protein kinase [Eggerthellaceae bacterium]|nr:serine/threonine protein kinase [Eggerthellaceae bacterium]